MTSEKDILHENGDFWVSNEGNKKDPKFHVWVVGPTHSVADSAYADISLAIARCDYMAKTQRPKEMGEANNKKQAFTLSAKF